MRIIGLFLGEISMEKSFSWDHTESNLYPRISLSDCTLSTIVISNKAISFGFDEGFLVSESNSVLFHQASSAEITIFGETVNEMEVYKEPYRQKKYPDKSLLYVPLNVFQESINSKEMICSFVEEYYSINGVIYKLFFKEKSAKGWIYLSIDLDNIVYNWND